MVLSVCIFTRRNRPDSPLRFLFLSLRLSSTIADLVKHSGLAVIKSKEILQTLMKVDLIHREHEKSVRPLFLLLLCFLWLVLCVFASHNWLLVLLRFSGIRVHVRQRSIDVLSIHPSDQQRHPAFVLAKLVGLSISQSGLF